MKTAARIAILIVSSPLWLIAIIVMFIGVLMIYGFSGEWAIGWRELLGKGER